MVVQHQMSSIKSGGGRGGDDRRKGRDSKPSMVWQEALDCSVFVVVYLSDPFWLSLYPFSPSHLPRGCLSSVSAGRVDEGGEG